MTVPTHGSLEIGVEKGLCQIYPTVVGIAVIEEGLDLTLGVSVESAEISMVMERLEILETGPAKGLFPHCHSRSAAQEMAGAQEQMMAQLQRASETEEHLQLNGAKAALHKDHRMGVRGLRDANSRNDLSLNAHLRLPSRTINGVPR